MANTRYQYVKHFEQDEKILLNTYFVVRIDGKGFHKFSDAHHFEKPNDINALSLMNKVATEIVKSYGDCVLAIGESDEFSFIFKRKTTLFNRRSIKILTTIVSQFTSMYVFYWPEFMKTPLQYPPSFDGRIVVYPSLQNIRDYISWRQADTHINNLYNTTFWALVLKGNETTTSAEKILNGSFSKDKNEILFSRFGINYNNEPEMYKKGSIIIREKRDLILKRLKERPDTISTSLTIEEVEKMSAEAFETVTLHCDVIRDDPFWKDHPDLLDYSVYYKHDHKEIF